MPQTVEPLVVSSQISTVITLCTSPVPTRAGCIGVSAMRANSACTRGSSAAAPSSSVRWLLRYIASHSFVPFAWYRIAFGLIVLLTWWTGVVVWQD